MKGAPYLKQENNFSHQQRRNAFLAAISAGAIWGVSFLAPRALDSADVSTLSFFRFLFFGVFSVGTLLIRRKKVPRLRMSDFYKASVLSLLGYSFYYFLLSTGVRNAGVAFTTVIIGLLPLSILLGSVPRIDVRHLALPFTFVLVGTVLIPFALFGPEALSGMSLGRSRVERAVGLLSAASALACWTAFSIMNSRFLKRRTDWTALDWSSYLGVFSAVTAFFIFWIGHPGTVVQSVQNTISLRFFLWTGFMGIMGSWLATSLWNYASRILPAAVVGQLLVTETVFGLCFGFFYERRLPSYLEGLSILFLLLGATFGIRAINRIMRSMSGLKDRTEPGM